jgi:hypothetical protein
MTDQSEVAPISERGGYPMNQQSEVGSLPLTNNESDSLSQQSILAQVKTLSHEQLNLYLHETKSLIKQLGYIMVNPRAPYPEVHRQSSHMVTRVDALREALVLEHVHRQLTYLQTEISKSAKLSAIPDSPNESNESNESSVHAAE